MLDVRCSLLALAAGAGVAWWQLATFRAMLPLARVYMMHALAIDERSVVPAEHAPEPVHATWREMGERPAGAFVLRLYAAHRR